MYEIFEKLKEIAVIPVIKITDADKAVPLAEALLDGGLPCVEITFRTAQAAEAIKLISKSMRKMMRIGAGTVLTPWQADAAKEAGAEFIVSPGLNPNIVRHCEKIGVPVLPGVCTPSEIEQALELNLQVLKFFPAEAMGGLKMVKALSAPYGGVSFVPTGGIGPDNLLAYLNFGKVLACGGSWMVKEDWIDAGDFGKVTQSAREAVAIRESRAK